MHRRVVVLLGCVAVLSDATMASGQDGKRLREPMVLVAARHLVDPNFTRTVVLVMFPPQSGATGVILNRPTDLQLRQIWPGREQRQGRTDTIHIGGPVQPDSLLYLFRMNPAPENAWPVIDDICLSGDGDLLDKLVEQQAGPAADQRFFAGYAGWLPGQLEIEIGNGDWYVLKADPDIIYDTDTSTLWWRLYRRATLPRAHFELQPGFVRPIVVSGQALALGR